MEKLVLFDPDKALMTDSKDTSEYVEESIRNIYGIIADVDLKDYEGESSQNVAEAVLREAGVPDEEIFGKLNRYMEDVYYTYYNVAGHDKVILNEGAKELLTELEKGDNLIGIATGEGERITRFKAEKAGIGEFFKLGSFGNTDKELKGIVENAMERARKEFGVSDAFVVASSTYVVKGAKEAGAKVIGVACGRYSAGELEHAGADLVVKGVKEKGRIVGFIKGH